MSKFLEAALEYARQGLSVIQLEVGGKRPMRPWAQFQTERATEDQIIQWWEEYPECNVGIICGKISGVVVIDVDPRNGGDPAEISEIVETWQVVKTGGGGVHFFCEYPASGIASKPNLRPGVDLKSDGGYVVAPPSIHPSGDPYVWIENSTRGMLPEWAFSATPPPAATPVTDSEPWIGEALAHPESVELGTQEHTLTRLAWYLSDKLPEDITSLLLQRWVTGLKCYDPHNPWDTEHAKERVERAYKKRSRERRFEIVDDMIPEIPKDKQGRLELIKSRIVSAKELAERPREQVEWLVEGLLAPSCLTEIVGPVKLGKSTFVCDMVKAIVCGEEFLGRRVKKSRVLILTEQLGISLERTLDRAGIFGHEGVRILTAGELMGLGWDETVQAATDYAAENECGLIVVDTLSRMARFTKDDENSSGAVMEAMIPFQYTQQKGIGIMVVRHARKSGGGIGQSGRGSNATTGVADICMDMTKAENLREIEIISRLSEEKNILLKFDDGHYALAEAIEVDLHKSDKELLERMPTEWMTVKQLALYTGLSSSTVGKSLSRFMEKEREDSFGMIEARKVGKAIQYRKTPNAYFDFVEDGNE